MTVVWSVLFILLLLAGWLLTLLSLPGNWVMVVAAAAYVALAGPTATSAGWWLVAALAVLALLGELAELVSGALGVGRAGGSRRGAVMAIFGSLVGAGAGLFVGLPIPLVGSLVAAVVFAGLGALVGAALGESWKGRSLNQSWQVGKAAFWGRLLGTLAKIVIATIMLVVGVAAIFA